MNSNFEFSTLQEIAQNATDKLTDGVGANNYGCDLHNDLFNSDYYIIGYYQAEEWLKKNTGVFNAIGIIQEYENDNFGEVCTHLDSAEQVVNMIVYIAGEEILQNSKRLQNKLDDRLTEEDIKAIISEIKEYYNI